MTPDEVRGDDARTESIDDNLLRVRHSAAHIMAEAVSKFFGDDAVKLGIGPATIDGFYYDFELPRPLTEADLPSIESRMREIIRSDRPFTRHEVSAQQARELFAQQPFKLELIDGILGRGLDDNGDPLPVGEPPQLTTYEHDGFEDLCRGPHVTSTGCVPTDAFKLLSVAGAYWRGDERRPMLQRIYGTAWRTAEELRLFLWRREEAERRDHRKLGRELELFHLDRTAPGMPYWLPNGLKLVNALLQFWRDEHEARGYQEISAPLVNERSLWMTSGHWDHYRSEMFVIPVSDNITYGLKPMNCPNAMVIYNLKTHSYRDLPYRLSDCDVLHRNERSGTLHGLLRVQKFQQDDAHIFCEESQIEAEYHGIFDICDRFYHLFDLDYRLRLGTRPDNAVGDQGSWDRAEATLRSILDERVGPGNYLVEEGGGAFYGPKIDIMMYDALARGWQMGTIQLDFQLPRRFNCSYVDRDGSKQSPVVIHRVIYGSIERFVGILIEHTAGAFPLWISPIQVSIVPVRDEQVGYASQIAEQFRRLRIRVAVHLEEGSLPSKIRKVQKDKPPVVLVVGAREVTQGTVSVRLRGIGDVGSVPVTKLIDALQREIENRSLALDSLAAVIGVGAPP